MLAVSKVAALQHEHVHEWRDRGSDRWRRARSCTTRGWWMSRRSSTYMSPESHPASLAGGTLQRLGDHDREILVAALLRDEVTRTGEEH